VNQHPEKSSSNSFGPESKPYALLAFLLSSNTADAIPWQFHLLELLSIVPQKQELLLRN
jgi:hypothetical protein